MDSFGNWLFITCLFVMVISGCSENGNGNKKAKSVNNINKLISKELKEAVDESDLSTRLVQKDNNNERNLESGLIDENGNTEGLDNREGLSEQEKNNIESIEVNDYPKVKAEVFKIASAYSQIRISNDSDQETGDITISFDDKPAFKISLFDSYSDACNAEKCVQACSNPFKLKRKQSCLIYIHGAHQYSDPVTLSLINNSADQRLEFTLNYEEKLYLSGNFTSNDEYYIAQYDLNTRVWSRLKADDSFKISDVVYVLEFDLDGNLYVAGKIKDGNDQYRILKYNLVTESWSELPQPITQIVNSDGVEESKSLLNHYIYGMAFDNNQNMYVSGMFNDGDKTYILQYNLQDSSWATPLSQPSESLEFEAALYDVIFDGNENIYTAGKVKLDDGNLFLGKYNINEQVWTTHSNTFATKSGNYFTQLCQGKDKNIYFVGSMSIVRDVDNVDRQYVLRYQPEDSSWLNLNSVDNDESTFFNMRTMACHADNSGKVYFAGHTSRYLDYNSSPNKLLMYYDPVNQNINVIDPSESLINDAIFGINSDVNGNIYITGNFKNSSGYRYVLKYVPSSNSWESLALDAGIDFNPEEDFSKGMFNNYGGYRGTLKLFNHLMVTKED